MFHGMDTVTLEDDKFFDFPCPTSTETYDAYVSKIQTDASNYKKNPQEPPVLDIVQRWRSLSPPHPPLAEVTDCRPFPTVVGHDTFKEDSKVNISLTERMHLGSAAQVWQGILSLKQSQGPPNIDVVPVVVKLFQESLFYPPPSSFSSDKEINTGDWAYGAKQARTEAWAYSSLIALQGKEIPWSYGIFKFKLKHGEIAYGHVMELVPGPSAERISFANYSEAQIYGLADYMTSTIYKVNMRGIMHLDVSKRNLIRQENSAYPLVLIDFSRAIPVTYPLVMAFDQMAAINVLRLMGAPGRTLKRWFEERKQSSQEWVAVIRNIDKEEPYWTEDILLQDEDEDD